VLKARGVKARRIVGLLLGGIGLLLIIVSAYYFHRLMFILGLRSSAYLDVYASSVVAPLLIGVLIVANGIFVASYRRRAAIPLYVLGDAAWIYFVTTVQRLMIGGVLEIEQYFLPSIIFFASVILLLIGALVNSTG
jgi:hypothetical protein